LGQTDRSPSRQLLYYAYNCRGHGASDKPAGTYTVATFGDDLAAVLDHAGWPSAAAAGASVGGGCATLAFATRHRARVDGLGLIDTTDWYGEEAPAAWEKRAKKTEQEGIASLVPFQVTRWFTEAFRKAASQTRQACVDVLACIDGGRLRHRQALPGKIVVARRIAGSGEE
jgi:3-oxoadipate enol-lactonase